jgi:penicillin-binding protein 1B
MPGIFLGFRRWSFLVRLILAGTSSLFFLLAAGVLAAYHIRFERMIEGRVSGQPLDSISSIFSAPKRIFVDQKLSPQELIEYLRRAGYADSPQQGATGQYLVADTLAEIRPSTRSYFEGKNAVTVQFLDSKISGIRSIGTGEELDSTELEPLLLTNIFNDNTREKQRFVPFHDLPPFLVDAVLSVEDVRFFEHHGVDPFRVLGAAWINVRRRTKAQGASTITMQTARSFFFSTQRTWRRKLKETLMALELERRFTKQQIFELYANQVYLGSRGSFAIHGFGEAAQAYFDKDVRELSLGEAAFLAGILRSPNRYASSSCTPELAAEVRDRVLVQMVRWRAISPENARAAKQAPLNCVENPIESTAAPYFLDMVRGQLLSKYSESDLLSKKYRIYTTLDPELERAAAEAVEGKIGDVDSMLAGREQRWRENGQTTPDPQVALVALDPRTGAVRALIGGRNYAQSQLNRALASRQPGSVFKPFVYAAAFSNTVESLTPIITPSTTVLDEPATFTSDGRRYTPNDYGSKFHGTVTLRDALVDSMNVATVKLAELIGYDRVAQVARRLGLGSNIQPTPLAAMGVYEMTPMDVAAGYTIFANGGMRAEPFLIERVIDPQGKVIEQNTPRVRQVLDRRVAYVVTSILEDVLDHGTAAGVRRQGFAQVAAGKTGTSGDGWFAGFTPDLLCVVWIGFDDDRDLALSGAQAAVPVWTDFMQRASSVNPYASSGGFAPPEGIKVVEIDPKTQELATPLCPLKREEVFIAGTEPTQLCDEHSKRMTVQVPIASWVSRHYEYFPNFCNALRCGIGER